MTALTEENKKQINAMTHEGLAKMWRFAPSSEPLIQGECGNMVKERLFNEFGGFTPALSKKIGW